MAIQLASPANARIYLPLMDSHVKVITMFIILYATPHSIYLLHMYVQLISECPIGTYTPQNSPCEPCPPNSEAPEPGMSECSCLEGYYRAPFEESHEGCTCEYAHFVEFVKQGYRKLAYSVRLNGEIYIL